MCLVSFLFIDSPTPYLSPLSLHDALPISFSVQAAGAGSHKPKSRRRRPWHDRAIARFPRCPRSALNPRSEEHTSELQSRGHLVCRLLLEKKKQNEREHNFDMTRNITCLSM